MMRSPLADFMPVEGVGKLPEDDQGVQPKSSRTCFLYHNCDFTIQGYYFDLGKKNDVH